MSRYRLLDPQFFSLLVLGVALLAGALISWSVDRSFLERATISAAVVEDKGKRSKAGSSDNYWVRYRWTDETSEPPRRWSGTDSWSGGEDAWRALEPGVSTVRVAWELVEEGRSTRSRLAEQGYAGFPWPMFIVGLGLLIAAVVRLGLAFRRRALR